MEKKEKKESYSKDQEKNLVTELEKLKQELKKCSKEREEYLNGWKRERADFLNYKKDEKARIEKVNKLAQIEALKPFLDILDSFERAEKQITQDLKDNPIIRGFLGIKKQIRDLISKYHIVEIDTQEGMEFDPKFCEAIEIIETKDPQKDHKIAEIVSKGYIFEDLVLRPHKVKVFKKVDK